MRRQGEPFSTIVTLITAALCTLLLAVFAGLLGYGETESIRDLFQEPEFRFALRLSLQTSVAATLLATVVAIPCGYFLARNHFPGKVVVDSLLELPIVLPPLVSGVALLIFFGPLLGPFLQEAGIAIVFTPLGVIVAQWFVALPLAIRSFRQAFAAVDPRMEKVARTLGCTPFQSFWRVVLPIARPGILGGMTMTWARTLGEFGATAMLAGVTRMKTETLPMAIYLSMTNGDLSFALAIATVLLLVALLVLTAFKVFMRTEVQL
ncbi:ABC transporter permease [Heliophilum fasciatum]|uniref:Molybdenum transport system permease n=1 Tax=Heliophilum fasciatum TaxID=35700 RepID=A0A4R2RJI3_9FIRM|nr:ABC transporter permease [Heliophilum fasciatum]MCW2278199.1 molybdate transport system permease protein [Heliophilum fasciatum]TCP63980.1 molybdate transport system permease protein [Heliophilum fasciatum]